MPPQHAAFLRDVLGWPYVEDALGGGVSGWLIFKTGRSEHGRTNPTFRRQQLSTMARRTNRRDTI